MAKKKSKPKKPPLPKSAKWRNRIIGHGNVHPNDLIANDRNWRKHPDAQNEALIAAIRRIGFVRSVTVNKRSGRIVDGHARVALAIREQQAAIPVEYVDLSDAEEKEALATLDPLSAMAEADDEMLQSLVDELNLSAVPEYEGLLDSLDELIEEVEDEPKGGGKGGDGYGGGSSDAQFKIIVSCDSEEEQAELLDELEKRKIACKALVG